MNTDPSGLRTATLRLALSFTALIVALFLIVAGVVVTLVATSEQEALTQQLLGAEHLDSPRDAPPGVYVAISGGQGPHNGQGEQSVQGDLVVSPNAPPGFPDRSMLQQVAGTGTTIQRTVTFGGDSFVVRTDGDSGRVVQVAVDKSESQAELRRVTLALAFSGIAAISGAVVAAWWMSRRAMRPLAEALALQRRFVADAGHELRTPLTLLSTRAQMLRRALPDPGLDEIVADAKALTGILEDLLISADPRQDAERVPVDLAALADEVVSAVRPEALERGIALERSGAPSAQVSGVRVSLSRLILALVSNALDHAQARVGVTVTVHGREIRLEVADDGPGFPHGTAERAFERFASSRTDDAGEGGQRHYGLGLALVAEVAQRHGGSVAIIETTGRGALVRVTLPAISSA